MIVGNLKQIKNIGLLRIATLTTRQYRYIYSSTKITAEVK